MIINKQGSSLLPGLKVFDLVNRQLLPPVLAFLLTAWPRLVLLFILQVDETGVAQQFSDEEMSLRLTWAWGLSPVSLQSDFPPFLKGLEISFQLAKVLGIMVLLDLGTLLWVPFLDCRPQSARLCEVLEFQHSHYCPRITCSIWRSSCQRAHAILSRHVLWIFIIYPELPMDQYCLDQYCLGDETIPGICIFHNLSGYFFCTSKPENF